MDPLELPDRLPGAIGAALQDDLSICAERARLRAARLRVDAERAVTAGHQRRLLGEAEGLDVVCRDPWFGWLVVSEEGELRRYRIGEVHHPGSRTVHWVHPLGRIFYERDPGEGYERRGGGGVIEGEVVARARVSHDDLVMQRAEWNDAEGRLELRRGEVGFVDPLEHEAQSLPAATGLPNVLAFLTREQYGLITAAHDAPLILQGKAGSGKTTVALYRLAWLTTPRQPDETPRVSADRVLFVMFNRALCGFVAQALRPLHLGATTVQTFHAWALAALREVYRGEVEPTPDVPAGSEVASRLKARLGMLAAIDAYVDRQARRMEQWLATTLRPYEPERWLGVYRAASGPALRRLHVARAAAKDARQEGSPRARAVAGAAYEVLRRAVQRMSLYKQDLRAILLDRELLAAHLHEASASELDTLGAYQDALQRRGAAEGRSVGKLVDFDDLALLLRILQVKHGGLPRGDDVFLYDHVVIDEAQDFGAVQLRTLLDAVTSRSGVTIVGDANQKIVPAAHFVGWDALAADLGVSGVAVTRLEVGHRSTGPIMTLCDAIVGVPSVGAGRPGPMPEHLIEPDEAAAIDRVVALATERLAEAPDAHVAVVVPRAVQRRRWLEALLPRLPGLSVRELHNRHHDFGAGVSVTNRRQVKGLEFDTVIAVDPAADAYPATDQGRRDLYVMASRARERLAFVSWREESPLLGPLEAAGALLRDDAVPTLVLEPDADEPF